MLRDGRQLQQLRRVVVALSRHHHETEEGVERGDDARLRTGLYAEVVEKDQIILQIGQDARRRLKSPLRQELQKLREVGRVRLNGVGSQRALQEQIVAVFGKEIHRNNKDGNTASAELSTRCCRRERFI